MAKVFISATTDDLGLARRLVKQGLETINLEAVEQTTFEVDYGTMLQRLKRKLEGCDAVVHIAGFRYGGEPAPAALPPHTPRRSYTQWEYHLAKQIQTERARKGKRYPIYVLVTGADFPAGPITAANAEDDTKRQLQLTHRALLNPEKNTIANVEQLGLRSREFQVELERLRDELANVRRAKHLWRLAAFALAVPVLTIALGGGLVEYGCRLPFVKKICLERGLDSTSHELQEISTSDFLGTGCQRVDGFTARRRFTDQLFVAGDPEGALENILGIAQFLETNAGLGLEVRACWKNLVGEVFYRNAELPKALGYYSAARSDSEGVDNLQLFALSAMNEGFTLARLIRKDESSSVFRSAVTRLSMVADDARDSLIEAWLRNWDIREHPSQSKSLELEQLVNRTDWNSLSTQEFILLSYICADNKVCPKSIIAELERLSSRAVSSEQRGAAGLALAYALNRMDQSARSKSTLAGIADDGSYTIPHRLSALQQLVSLGESNEKRDMIDRMLELVSSASVDEQDSMREIVGWARYERVKSLGWRDLDEMKRIVEFLAGVAETASIKRELLERIAENYGAKLEFEKQLQVYRELEKLKPNDLAVEGAWTAAAIVGQGKALVAMGKLSEAKTAFERVKTYTSGLVEFQEIPITILSQNILARRELGALGTLTGDLESAMSAYEAAIALGREYIRLAPVEDRWGRPLVADMFNEYGQMLLYSHNKPDEAIGRFKQSLEETEQLNPEDRPWRLFAPLQPMAYAYRAKGDFEQAKVWFQRAHEAALVTEGHNGLARGQNGNTLGTLINWGNFLIERGEHQSALQRADDAWRLFGALQRNDPQNDWIAERGPAVLLLKGKAHEGLRQFDEAITAFRQAAKLSSAQSFGDTELPVGVSISTLDALFCLSRVLRNSGDEAQANADLKKAKVIVEQYLAVVPNDEWVKWLMTEIKKLEQQ